MYKPIRQVSARHRRRLKQKVFLSAESMPSASTSFGGVVEDTFANSSNLASFKDNIKTLECVQAHNQFDQNNSTQGFDSDSFSEASSGDSSNHNIFTDSDYFIVDSWKSGHLTSDLKDWVLDCKVPQTHVTKLLGILRKHSIKVPLDARTLLNTQRNVDIKSVAPGSYSHIGLKTGLLKFLDILPENFEIPPVIKININIDGLPLIKSSGSQFWPILAWFSGSVFERLFEQNVFVIGVYHGHTKPTSSYDFLTLFCEEFFDLKNTGFEFRNCKIFTEINAIICDAPARAFVTCIKNHTGYYGCGKCIQEGEFIQNRMTFPDLNSTLRTDESFKNKLDEDHHTGNSILESLDIGMVSQIPLDYMHLVCLGVTKRLLQFWYKGKQDVRIPAALFGHLSEIILSYKSSIPMEFSRKPRMLSDVDRFKATEFRQILLYTGIVALKDILPEDKYYNFLLLSCAIRILVSPDLCIKLNEKANNLIRDFVATFGNIYGKQYITYNVHNLLHLCNDVKKFGSLDNFSAFPPESYMFQIKQKICVRSGKPLQQFVKRLSEENPKLRQRNSSENVLSFNKKSVEIQFKNFTLSNQHPNNYCLLKSGHILALSEIKKQGNLILIEGQNLKVERSFFIEPIDSRELGICLCSLNESFSSVNIKDIFCKMVVFPYQGLLVVLPLVHTCEKL